MKRVHLSSYEYLNKDVSYLPHMSAHFFKPNGLWYAMDDEWQDWYDKNEKQIDTLDSEIRPDYKYSHELDIDMSKVYVLDDVNHVMEFHWKFGYKVEGNL